ncbi:AMP-binding protein [Streptomyces uncialis]|uniref:AMP-binding protein n=1 Tax=Streptomyces uncialis TaxID=1048205 RepID=UPI00225140F3|nr:AMP-binding protein [Streptomyces uncialis]MCX4657993.1 AMP-binding protein [Streptomyces uncialis]
MPSNETYVSQILEVISAEPEKVVLSWQDRTLTAAELTALVRSAAQALHRHTGGDGKATDAVVAVLTVTNTAPTLVLRYAANLIGATVVHLHTTNAVDPADHLAADAKLKILQETGATHLAVDAENVTAARELSERSRTPLVLVGLGALGPDVLDLTAGNPDAFDPAAIEIGLDRTAVVTYTSGTTGEPKGIAVDFRTRNGFISAGLQMGWRSVYLATLPLSHSSGATTDDSLASGGSVVLRDGFEPGDVLRSVERHGITRMLLSPPQLYMLMDHSEAGSADLSSLQMVTYVGSPASPERLAEAVKLFGDVLIQVYATSEAGFVSMLSPAEHLDARLRTTVGRPMPGWVRIRDRDDSRDLPTGETGEVCVRSAFTMSEYVGEPELTARTVRDGWVHTGDLGFVDGDGYLHLRGRIGEVIKTNGIKIHPVTVENAFLAHPDVVQAGVFCVRDKDRIEHMHAAVVLREPGAVTAAELADHVGAVISPKHVPAKIGIRTALPLTGAGKPDKARLAAEASV